MTEIDSEDALRDEEKSWLVGIVVSNQTGVKLEQLLRLTEWWADPISKMCRVILSRLGKDNEQNDMNSDDIRWAFCSDKATTVLQNRKSMQVYRILWMTTQQCFKPSVISNLLCISRQKVYDTLIKARNEQKRMKRTRTCPEQILIQAKVMLYKKVQAFIKENAHNLFSKEDVRRDIGTVLATMGIRPQALSDQS